MEIKVTPDRLLPIIPKATRYQGDLCLLMKKSSVDDPREVNQARKSSSKKYPATIAKITEGDIPAETIGERYFKGSVLKEIRERRG